MSMPLNLHVHESTLVYMCIVLTYEFQYLLVPSRGRTHLRHHTYLIGRGHVLFGQVVKVKLPEKMDLLQMDMEHPLGKE